MKMATKPQAKAAIDNALIDMKADIDSLPVNVSIIDGSIAFGPTRYSLVLSAENSKANAFTLLAAVEGFLTAQARAFLTTRLDRRSEDRPKRITITETKLTIHIVNF